MVFPGVEAAANSFIERVKSHPNIYGQYLKVMSGYATKQLDVSAVVSELETLFQSHEDLLTGYRMFLPLEWQETLPSVKPRQSRNKNLVATDMNSSSKSPSSSSEEIRQKTTEENIIYMQMEDEMFEIDIRLSRMRTTVQSAEALMQNLRDSMQQHQIINIVDNYFSDVSLSCIREEYKEQSFFIIRRLKKDPKHVLPQILSKLKSKKKKLIESKEKLLKRWREVHHQKKISLLIASRKE